MVLSYSPESADNGYLGICHKRLRLFDAEEMKDGKRITGGQRGTWVGHCRTNVWG